MVYKMPSPKSAKRPRASAFYMPYSPITYVITIIASVRGL